MSEINQSVHEWFELGYSSYLVLPRSVMDAMPMDWQHKMTALLDEIRETVAEIDPDFNDHYTVLLRGEKGRIVKDEYANYRRPTERLVPLYNRNRESALESDTTTTP